MSPHESDRRHIERQVAYARPMAVFLTLIALLEQPWSRAAKRSVSFLLAYLGVALLAILFEALLRKRSWHLPLPFDLLVLGIFLVISPSTVPAWFPYLFVCYVAGIRWGLSSAFPLAGLLSLEIILLTVVKGEIHFLRIV